MDPRLSHARGGAEDEEEDVEGADGEMYYLSVSKAIDLEQFLRFCLSTDHLPRRKKRMEWEEKWSTHIHLLN